ncbi:LuxR C-terminal-related transcriptional regulator [Microbacterium sp. YY-03]|uniref:helix-turn-helix transcriptional regulator n=1 Tax=Microbacterium sp. YY-03 TaxID=3421636 RepID=UPI003D167A32
MVADALIAVQTQPSMTLLVDGLAGMGKTYLLRALGSAATAANFGRVSYVRADEIESDEPYSFIERLVESSGVADWHFVPQATTEPIALARECVTRLTPETDDPSHLIIIDDAHWIDSESQRVLRYLIPRVTRRRVTLAFGVRTPYVDDSFGAFLSRLTAENPGDLHYALAPLKVADVAAYAAERLGASISPDIAQFLLAESNGTFFALEGILSALTEAEISRLHLGWDTPIRTLISHSNALLRPVTNLPAEARRAVEIVCLAGHEISADAVNATAHFLGETVDLNAAVSAGVLINSAFGTATLPQHALLAQAVNDTVSPERRRAILRALAGVTSGYASVRHALLGAEEWTPQLLSHVDQFVHDAARRGATAHATDVLRVALDLADSADMRAHVLESLALVHLQAKTAFLMLDLLPEIEELEYTPLRELIVIVLAAHKFREHVPMERAQRLLMTPPQSADDHAAIGFFAFMMVILTMRSPDRAAVPHLIAHAKNLIASGPQSEADLTDKRLGWMIDPDGNTAVLDSYQMVQDQFATRIDAVSEALPQLTERVRALPDSTAKVDAAVSIAGAKQSIGDIDGAREMAQFSVDLLERVGQPWAASTARLILGDCLVLQGSYGDAAELMAVTEQVSFTTMDVETRFTWSALRVFIAAVMGGDKPEFYLERARRQKDIPWEAYGPDLLVIAECELARARGNHEAILEASSSTWVGRLVNTRHGFLTYRVNALISTGAYDEARELITQLEGWQGMRWHEAWGSLDWLRARLAQHTGDAKTARWYFESAAMQKDFPLPHALTLADFGAFLLQQGETELAVKTLTASHAALNALGANSYLPRVASLLAKHSPVGNPSDGPDRLLALLTEREQQIVPHLIKGRSNSQIAESLVVSVTTVRTHVSNILRKLRLTSRGEVSRRFRDATDASPFS